MYWDWFINSISFETFAMTIEQTVSEMWGKDYQLFGLNDPFNPNNFVEGFLCTRAANDYGSLMISKVNGTKCPQLIQGTPKLHYPFDKNGNWNFPSARKILVYEKLDGTNVVQYVYGDKKQTYTSYKTRLRPFLSDGRFGDFFGMWQDMLKKYPNINKIAETGVAYSFELYGYLNRHLIEYSVGLDCALLFIRYHSIYPPTKFDIFSQ